MSSIQPFPRACFASSSRRPMRPSVPRFSHLATRLVQPIPFFTPPSPPSSAPLLLQTPSKSVGGGRGEDQDAGPPRWKGEEEVDDREWEIRVGESLRTYCIDFPPFSEISRSITDKSFTQVERCCTSAILFRISSIRNRPLRQCFRPMCLARTFCSNCQLHYLSRCVFVSHELMLSGPLAARLRVCLFRLAAGQTRRLLPLSMC